MARPSEAQARLILRLWLSGDSLPHAAGTNPTWDAVIRRGWVTATGETFIFPTGATAPRYRANLDGLSAARDALSRYIARNTPLP